MQRALLRAWRHSSSVCDNHAEQCCALWGALMDWTWPGLRHCLGEPGWKQGAPGLLERLVQPSLLFLVQALQGYNGGIVGSTYSPTPPHPTFAPRAGWRGLSAWALWPGEHRAPSHQCHRRQGNIRTGRAGRCQDSEQRSAVSITAARVWQKGLPV